MFNFHIFFKSFVLSILLNAFSLISISSASEYSADVKKLRDTRSCVGCIFKNEDLSGLNLFGANLKDAKFSKVNLTGARLSDAILINTAFYDTNFQDAILNRSDFSGATIINSNLSGTSLIETVFSGALLENVDLRNAKFRNTNLTETILKTINLSGSLIESWTDNNAKYCNVIDPSNVNIVKDCQVLALDTAREFTQIQSLLSKLGYEIGSIDGKWGSKTENALKDFFKDNKLNEPEYLKIGSLSILSEFAAKNNSPDYSSMHSNIDYDIQDGLYALGYRIKPDGNIGTKTKKTIDNYLNDNSFNFSEDDLVKIRESIEANLVKRAVTNSKPVSWKYRAAEITIDADTNAVNIYDGLDTIQAAAKAGFNTISIFIHCDRRKRIEKNIPDYYPLYRTTGCSIPYVRPKDDLLASSENATDVYIKEAKKYGLKVTLKPMFLDLTDADEKNTYYGYKSKKVPIKDFFDGNGSTFDGYVEIIKKMARYAEDKEVDFLQIGTEFKNLNPRITKSERWVKIIRDIRDEFNGQLIYAYNMGPKGTGQNDLFSMKSIWQGVDYIGINLFPNQMLKGKKYYRSSEITNAFKTVSFDNKKVLNIMKSLSAEFGKKIILTETSFPTWRGSVNWMFRQKCDFNNKGKKDWIYTKGPLAVKEPSAIAALVLADGWFKTFSNHSFIHGATHVFWYLTWYDNQNFPEADQKIGFSGCGGHIYENDNLTKIISSYYQR
tara:strand:+ start:228 stop:2396 length:2169 start_codon:yes stop_codon:yes gene_type:complete